jgi:hypothetical protein
MGSYAVAQVGDVAITSALRSHAVAQVQHTRPVQGAEQFELDVVGG